MLEFFEFYTSSPWVWASITAGLPLMCGVFAGSFAGSVLWLLRGDE